MSVVYYVMFMLCMKSKPEVGDSARAGCSLSLMRRGPKGCTKKRRQKLNPKKNSELLPLEATKKTIHHTKSLSLARVKQQKGVPVSSG